LRDSLHGEELKEIGDGKKKEALTRDSDQKLKKHE
jgi:hypothetical protein